MLVQLEQFAKQQFSQQFAKFVEQQFIFQLEFRIEFQQPIVVDIVVTFQQFAAVVKFIEQQQFPHDRVPLLRPQPAKDPAYCLWKLWTLRGPRWKVIRPRMEWNQRMDTPDADRRRK
jgi:hypothetical protein